MPVKKQVNLVLPGLHGIDLVEPRQRTTTKQHVVVKHIRVIRSQAVCLSLRQLAKQQAGGCERHYLSETANMAEFRNPEVLLEF